MNSNYRVEEHKELTKKIMNCDCMPLGSTPYCEDCHNAVKEFMNKYGAGVLTRDIQLDNLSKDNSKLISKIEGLENKLKKKSKELKKYKANISLIKGDA